VKQIRHQPLNKSGAMLASNAPFVCVARAPPSPSPNNGLPLALSATLKSSAHGDAPHWWLDGEVERLQDDEKIGRQLDTPPLL